VTDFGVKLPDVGEGVAEAELISWHVAVGDTVTTESVLAEVMTDKATVEISSPVAGVVTALHGEPGATLAVGAPIVTVALDGSAPAAAASGPAEADDKPAAPAEAEAEIERPQPRIDRGERVMAAPAVRARARELGIDLAAVPGTGPEGRVVHADLDRLLADGNGVGTAAGAGSIAGRSDEPRVETVRGLRRRIAERLTSSWTQIPHITYVEAIDVTDLEALRTQLNQRGNNDAGRLTILPFLVRAIVIAVGEQPRLNSHYDGATQALSTFDAVHVGIATQTDDGLMVPVVHHAEARDLWDIAAEIGRLSVAARDGKATLRELTGSTITITSLAALGGLVTTPIINQPEVAIIGVNKIETRPMWRDGAWAPRSVMNLSSSFDHRIVDGWDAATFVQRIRALLEMPALLFVDD
jgi:2-oxoisovalerate dehydrogenase E2 component (dihydrolipoyl transacylase)